MNITPVPQSENRIASGKDFDALYRGFKLRYEELEKGWMIRQAVVDWLNGEALRFDDEHWKTVIADLRKQAVSYGRS